MNKQDIIYKAIREKVVCGMWCYVDDSEYIDEIVDYIIEISNLENTVECLRYITNSKEWDSDEAYSKANVTINSLMYWFNKTKILADKAEDTLLVLYEGVK